VASVEVSVAGTGLSDADEPQFQTVLPSFFLALCANSVGTIKKQLIDFASKTLSERGWRLFSLMMIRLRFVIAFFRLYAKLDVL